MAISESNLLAWNQTLCHIMTSDSPADTLPQLLKALETLTLSSGSMVIVYPAGKKPFVPCHSFRADEPSSLYVDQYIDGPYLVDPYYRMAFDQKAEGAYTIDRVAPDGFKETEFYKTYYSRTGLVDEACFLIQQPDAVALLSTGREQGETKYSTEEQDLLDALYPVVQAVLTQWLQQHSQPTEGANQHLDTALECFGSSILTERECDVVNLMLRGHSSKSIAEKLQIGAETIKHHRKHIYTKLDVSTQAELFFLFLDSLRNIKPGDDPDPLVAYLLPNQAS